MEDFDKIFRKTRVKKPSKYQIKKWKKAVRLKSLDKLSSSNRRSNSIYLGQMLAAVLAGVVVGGVLFSNQGSYKNEKTNDSSYEDATIEYIYYN